VAQINVTEVLVDPDFVDAMQLINRRPRVNSLGENMLADVETINSFGSVQPASGKVLQRLPEALRSTNVCSFWFKGKIIASEPGKYASIIVFKGSRFQVQSVMDWSNWGEGWTEGTCVAEALS
jgi:hypothetical protein